MVDICDCTDEKSNVTPNKPSIGSPPGEGYSHVKLHDCNFELEHMRKHTYATSMHSRFTSTRL